MDRPVRRWERNSMMYLSCMLHHRRVVNGLHRIWDLCFGEDRILAVSPDNFPHDRPFASSSKIVAVDSLVRLHHGLDRKALLDTPAARRAIDFVNALQCLHGFVNTIDQKSGLSVFDDFAAGTQIHGDDGHARGIGFRQNQAKSFRDSVQMEQRSGPREQFVLARDVHRSDIADLVIVQIGFHLLLENIP